uniref:Uncharacterized protein n=1 Tax=Amphimedon queenslandica TaxID=400682 RepID=A0A1X7T3E7_AMPQE
MRSATGKDERIIPDLSVIFLVQTLLERGHLVTNNLQNVFDWLDASGCDYPEQLCQYCNRYGMQVPMERRYRKSPTRNCHVNL